MPSDASPAAVVLAIVLFACGCTEHVDSPRHHVAGGDERLGEALLVEWRCGACHVIPGVRAARGTVGPPLTDFALRAYIAGAVVNEPANLVRWIMDPQAIEPGTVMPNLGVSAEEARHMAAFLYTLGSGRGTGPPHLIPVEALDPLRPGAH